jgi:hypothetical protein
MAALFRGVWPKPTMEKMAAAAAAAVPLAPVVL